MRKRIAILLFLLGSGWLRPDTALGVAAADREQIRTSSGRLLGEMLPRSDGKVEARDAAGRLLGTYDRQREETRDRAGRLLFRGNALAALIVCGSGFVASNPGRGPDQVTPADLPQQPGIDTVVMDAGYSNL